MTAATALVEESDHDVRQMVRPDQLSCPQQVYLCPTVVDVCGTDRSLVTWIDRRIKCQQQESFTLTLPTIPQFNLTKIEFNRLNVR